MRRSWQREIVGVARLEEQAVLPVLEHFRYSAEARATHGSPSLAASAMTLVRSLFAKRGNDEHGRVRIRSSTSSGGSFPRKHDVLIALAAQERIHASVADNIQLPAHVVRKARKRGSIRLDAFV